MTTAIEKPFSEFYEEAKHKVMLKKKKLNNTFISNVVDVGKELLKYREELTKEKKWCQFLEDTDISQTTAGLFIKAAECSEAQGETGKLFPEIVTNWKALTDFVRLPEPLQNKVFETAKTNKEINKPLELKNILKEVEPEEDEPEENDGIIIAEYTEIEKSTDIERANASETIHKLLEMENKMDPKVIPDLARGVSSGCGFRKQMDHILEGLLFCLHGSQILRDSDLNFNPEEIEAVSSLIEDLNSDLRKFQAKHS